MFDDYDYVENEYGELVKVKRKDIRNEECGVYIENGEINKSEIGEA